MNSRDWPMKSPSSSSALSAPIAASLASVPRMIETAGKVRFRKTVGSGIIKLVWKSSPPSGFEFRSGKTSPFVGSVSGV